MPEKELQEWEIFEKKACNIMAMEHQGGPKKSDCIDLENHDYVAEAKSYRRDFNAWDLDREINKPRMQGKTVHILVEYGCTQNAIKKAEENPNVILTCNVKHLFEKEIDEIRKKSRLIAKKNKNDINRLQI